MSLFFCPYFSGPVARALSGIDLIRLQCQIYGLGATDSTTFRSLRDQKGASPLLDFPPRVKEVRTHEVSSRFTGASWQRETRR